MCCGQGRIRTIKRDATVYFLPEVIGELPNLIIFTSTDERILTDSDVGRKLGVQREDIDREMKESGQKKK
jgi:hypothetical protein